MEFNAGKKKDGHKSVQDVKKLSIEEYKARMTSNKLHQDNKSTPNRAKKTGFLSEREIQRALKEEELIPGVLDDSNITCESNEEALNENIFNAANKPVNCIEKRKNSVEEPEILTLSSDEDDPIEDSTKLDGRLCHKEPIITNNMKFSPDFDPECHDNSTMRFVTVTCRAIRIGSHKFIPIGNVAFCKQFFTFTASAVGNPDVLVAVNVPLECVVKILYHFEPGMTSIFVYLTPPFASHLRQKLDMKEGEGGYYDPCSLDESKKRLIIFIDKISNILIKHFVGLYANKTSIDSAILLEDLTKDEVNSILVASSPKDISAIKKSAATRQSSCKTILIYPPSPSKGRITINVGDYECLAEEQFLNDVIIDFYLKWLHLEKLPAVYRNRTHVFSTFFYKRLTAKPKKGRRTDPHETDVMLTPAQKRHGRVKSWTKGVNIFEKDFILIPINERSHWFLAVICFPGANIGVPQESTAVEEVRAVPTRSSERTRSKVQMQLELDLEWSDRDEAESDEELNGVDEFQEGKFSKQQRDEQSRCFKHPCVLIFDSLRGSNRSRIVSTLREYLTVEYQERNISERKFTKDNMEGFLPKVPQQMNYSDCGVYTLQFAESLFEDPIKNYKLPIKSLEEWFPQEMVLGKRESIACLINSLVMQANMQNRHPIPDIKFPSKKKSIPADNEPESQEDAESTSAKRKTPDEELQGNDFNPINLPAMKCCAKKINVNLSRKTIASTMDMKAELDKYCVPPHLSGSLELIRSSYLDLTDDPQTDKRPTVDDDIYGDLDPNDTRASNNSASNLSLLNDSSSSEKLVQCSKKLKLSPDATSSAVLSNNVYKVGR